LWWWLIFLPVVKNSVETRVTYSLRCYNSVALHNLAGENFGIHISVLSCGADFEYAAHKA
jgi:hypothetical protein